MHQRFDLKSSDTGIMNIAYSICH